MLNFSISSKYWRFWLPLSWFPTFLAVLCYGSCPIVLSTLQWQDTCYGWDRTLSQYCQDWGLDCFCETSRKAPYFILFLIPRIESLICPTMPLCLIRQFVLGQHFTSFVFLNLILSNHHGTPWDKKFWKTCPSWKIRAYRKWGKQTRWYFFLLHNEPDYE